MTFLLDANVVSYFLQAEREKELGAAGSILQLAIVDEVRLELAQDPALGGPGFKAWLETAGVTVHKIPIGSPAASTLQSLLVPGAPKQGLGERASIALAAHDASLCFVTHDKGAMRIALPELWMPGERLVVLAPFLRRLHDSKAMTDVAAIDDVATVAGLDAPPTWWASWRASIE